MGMNAAAVFQMLKTFAVVGGVAVVLAVLFIAAAGAVVGLI